jgi:hypothetical protein
MLGLHGLGQATNLCPVLLQLKQVIIDALAGVAVTSQAVNRRQVRGAGGGRVNTRVVVVIAGKTGVEGVVVQSA